MCNPYITCKIILNISNKITNLIKSYIPNSVLNSNINSEISFILPAIDSDKFSSLFERIEKEKEDLKIVNVGISVTTIEDVFLRYSLFLNFNHLYL